MRRRLRTYARNLDPVNWGLLLLIGVGLGWNGWLALSKPFLRPGLAATALGIALPYFVRNWLVTHCRLVTQVSQVVWVAGLLGSVFRPHLVRGGLLETALWLVVGLYLGVQFWLLSDDRIVYR